MQCREPDSDDERDEGCLSGMVRVFGEADQGHEAAQRLQQLHELSRFVRATVRLAALPSLWIQSLRVVEPDQAFARNLVPVCRLV
jgi:hypothetical protein